MGNMHDGLRVRWLPELAPGDGLRCEAFLSYSDQISNLEGAIPERVQCSAQAEVYVTFNTGRTQLKCVHHYTAWTADVERPIEEA